MASRKPVEGSPASMEGCTPVMTSPHSRLHDDRPGNRERSIRRCKEEQFIAQRHLAAGIDGKPKWYYV
jgi:hypothetical protein